MPIVEDVNWCDEAYSPTELLEAYKDKLPIITVVTNGYYGQSEMDTFAQDQVRPSLSLLAIN